MNYGKKITEMFYGADEFAFKKAEEFRKNMTNAEKILWDELRNNKLMGMKFRRQHPINRFVVDFYCHKIKLVIEIDGNVHNETEVKENDIRRQEELETFGLKIIRFSNEDIFKNISNVLNQIKLIVDEELNK